MPLLLLAVPNVVSSSMDKLQKSVSLVKETALRQHFPETFLWFHITNLGYLTVHFTFSCGGSYLFCFIDERFSLFRVKYAGSIKSCRMRRYKVRILSKMFLFSKRES
jgi:hypothetical protein